jgi:hypothetical protein
MSTKTDANPLRVLNVSMRDRAIYQAVMVDGKSQRAMAVEHKLSQPRVSAIIKRVGRWLSQGVPPGFGELYRRDRLRVVSRLHRMRLEQLYCEAVEAWRKSDTTTHTIKEKTVKGEVVSQDRQVQTRLRDRRYLEDICAITDRIVAFEGFEKLGKVDESCDGRIYEEPERTPVDTYREVKRRTILGGFDTPGDEGIPGLWEKEMVRRNAEVGAGEVRNAEAREVGNAECGLRSEGKVRSEEPAERQLASHSLAPVLRGEGRGEGPAPQEDSASSEESAARSEEVLQITEEYTTHTSTITTTTPQQSGNNTGITPTETLSKKSPCSAQVPQKSAVTNSQPEKKSLSNSPPKGPRFRLMGTAAEMAESLGYDDFFSPEQRLARAFEKARASRESRAEESRERGRPLTPALSPEYRGEGVGRNASPTPSPHLPLAAPTARE